MMRLLSCLVYLLPTLGWACSCVDFHQPLEEALCQVDTAQNQYIAEIILHRQLGDNTAEFDVVRYYAGTPAKSSRLHLSGGSPAMCGIDITGESEGQRFLYFGYNNDWPDREYDGYLFKCLYAKSLYRMNRRGTQVEYTYTDGRTEDGRAVGLRFRPMPNANDYCNPGAPSPLAALRVVNSLSDGRIGLSTAGTEAPLPRMQHLTVVLPDGREVATYDLRDYRAGQWLDIGRLPAGVLFLVISDGVRRRTLRAVRQ